MLRFIVFLFLWLLVSLLMQNIVAGLLLAIVLYGFYWVLDKIIFQTANAKPQSTTIQIQIRKLRDAVARIELQGEKNDATLCKLQKRIGHIEKRLAKLDAACGIMTEDTFVGEEQPVIAVSEPAIAKQSSNEEIPAVSLENKAASPEESVAATTDSLPPEELIAANTDSLSTEEPIAVNTDSIPTEEIVDVVPEPVAAIADVAGEDSFSPKSVQTTKAHIVSPKPAQTAFRFDSWESFVGEKLLSYVGIVIFVLGLAFLLAYSLTKMGPSGRVATGVLCASGLLVGGFLLEGYRKYTLFGRVLMAGGWATLYFTAYGAYHLQAMRVIDHAVVGTVVLALVAMAIIFHTLKYASETLTGVALLLAYITLFVSDVSLYTHVAAVLLAIIICVFTWKFGWITTRLVGVILLYGGYGAWFYMQGIQRSLPQNQTEYTLVTFLLVGLWCLFKIPDFAKIRSPIEHKLFPVIGILNLVGLALSRKILHVVFHTSGNPETALYLGAIYLPLAQLLRMRGRMGVYRLDATVSLLLFMVGTWCVFDQYAHCMVAWIVLGIITFIYSLYRDDRYFRDLGNIVTALATLMALGGDWPKKMVRLAYQFFSGELFLSLPTSLPDKPSITSLASGIVGILGASVLYILGFVANSVLMRKGKTGIFAEIARDRSITILATLAMMTGFYKTWDGTTCVYAWLALGALLFQYGIWRKEYYIRLISHAVVLCSLCVVNLFGLTTTQIGVTMAIGAIIMYIDGFITFRLSNRQQISNHETFIEKGVTLAATIAAMVALSLLFMPCEFFATLSWLALTPLLFFYAIFRRDEFIRLLSYSVLIAATIRASIPVITDQHIVHIAGNWHASSGLINLAIATTLFYVHAWLINHFLAESKTKVQIIEEESCLVGIGCITLFVSLWFTLPTISIAIAYAICAVIFLECGLSWQRTYLRTYSGIGFLLSGFHLFIVNLGAIGHIGGVPRRIITSLPVLALWSYAAIVWQKVIGAQQKVLAFERLIPSIISYMNFTAILVLLYYHAYQDGLGWAAYGAILLGVCFALKHTRYSIQAAIALLMATFSVCATATVAAGDTMRYLNIHPALILTPLLIFVAHTLCRVFTAAKVAEIQGGPRALVWLRKSEQIYGLTFCAVVTFLISYLVVPAYYSFAWGIEALTLAWYGLSVRLKSFRWVALGLFTASVFKILLYDIFYFSTEKRIVILIGVGIALLLISFLYNRLKDELTRFLMND